MFQSNTKMAVVGKIAGDSGTGWRKVWNLVVIELRIGGLGPERVQVQQQW